MAQGTMTIVLPVNNVDSAQNAIDNGTLMVFLSAHEMEMEVEVEEDDQ